MTDVRTRAEEWLTSGDTGASSKALWSVMMGVPSDKSHPHDGADLGRCIRLLDRIPEWKPRLKEMAAVSPYWAVLVENWDGLVERHKLGSEYAFMRKLLDPIEEKDPRVFRLGKGVTIRFA
jgi:hypothetical protein